MSTLEDIGLAGFGPGSQAIWEMGDTLILAEMDAAGVIVDVTVMDRGWEGEKRQERYRIAKDAGDAWSADIPSMGSQQSADWTDLLPVPCLLMPPTEVTGPSFGSTAAF